MKTNMIFAALAYLCLTGFLGTLAYFVPHPDLVLMICLVLALALYDLWTELRIGRR
jgi:hypothetical protein